MRLPKHNEIITICGDKYKIKYVNKLPNRWQGECDVRDKVIKLLKCKWGDTGNRNLDPMKRTFLHESCHAIWHLLDWGSNESQVEKMALMLYSLLEGNNL